MPQAQSNTTDSPRLLLTLGDHHGIGAEIIVKALIHPEFAARSDFQPVVVGSHAILSEAASRWAPALELRQAGQLDEAMTLCAAPGSPAVTCWDPTPHAPPGEANLPEQTYIRAAAEACLDGTAAALVTAPISKESMYARGFTFPGHTEYLAHVTGTGRSVMAFAAPGLKVSLVTVHIPIQQVPQAISQALILETLEISARDLRRFFGIEQPHLAICGLNPHAGEKGKIGKEEQLIIEPAVEQARARGVRVSGPLPADTVFGQAVKGKFDLVVALYHDQGLIPVKLLSFGESVNLTMGLPIVRTSVDHGVAYDIAGQGIADESSMRAAIRLALNIVSRRQ